MVLKIFIIYYQNLYLKKKLNKERLLFDGPIFAQGWDEPETYNKTVIEDNVYTFSN